MRSGGSANDQAPTRMPRPLASSVTIACMQVHRRIAEEARHEGVGRPAVDLERLADLHHLAAVHDADARPHGHRLDLVVRDVDHRGAEAAMQRRDLAARRDAQRRVEVGQRLVEQEHLRIAHDRAPERHALPLPAGQRMRLAVEQGRQPERGRDAGDAALDLVARRRRGGAGRTPGSPSRSCADRARRTGTPWRCRGPWRAPR